MSADAPHPARKQLTPKKIAGYVASILIVVGIFVWAVPQFADYHDVWAALSTLTPIEFWSLFAAMVFNLFTYWWANQAALPGLRLGHAAVVTQTTTSIANTFPAGGAVAVGLTYSILNSWGFSGNAIALYVGVTGIWNIFAKLALPVLALVLLAVTGSLTPAYAVAAAVGIGVLVVAVALFVLIFRSERLARRVGDALGRAVSALTRVIRKPPVQGWGDRAASFRADTIGLVGRRWLPLTLFTLLSHVALFVVLLLALRHMGVAEDEVSTVQAFSVYTFARLLSAVPITPGGVGVIDLGYIGGLAAFDQGEKAQMVAAVLLFRALTYAIQIPLGAVTYLIWRGKADWRRSTPVAASAAE